MTNPKHQETIFNLAIGNPPYNKEKQGESNKQPPIYHMFMEQTYKTATISILITPARFLFNSGLTPHKWNKKMLNDDHFKVLEYKPNSLNTFQNINIAGGVAIHMRNKGKGYSAIKEFIQYPELKSILRKIRLITNTYLDTIISPRANYKLSYKFLKDYPHISNQLKRIGINSNFFDKFPEVNSAIKNERNNEYTEMYYKSRNKRKGRRGITYIKKSISNQTST